MPMIPSTSDALEAFGHSRIVEQIPEAMNPVSGAWRKEHNAAGIGVSRK